MMGLKKLSLLAAAACVWAPLGMAAAETGVPTVPVEVWAQRDTITSVDISPDGKHLLMLQMPSKKGEAEQERRIRPRAL